MLTTVKGIYENGVVFLDEIPEAKNKSKVVVTFLEDALPAHPEKRRLGSLKGKVSIPENFNEPLEDLKDYMY
ncbi:MAG: DUF2281 domain-containing protein [Niabella sp.]